MSAGLLLGLGAALAWGMTDVSGTLAGRRLGSLPTVAAAQTLSVVVLLGVAVLSPVPARWDFAAMPISVALGVLAAVAYLSFFTALRIGPLTVVSPLVAAYGGVVVILAVIFRGETLTPLQAAGAALATVGVVLTGLVFDGGWRSARLVGPGVPFAIVSLLSFAVVTVALADPIARTGWLPAITWSRFGNVALALLLLGVAVVLRPRFARPLMETSGPRDRRGLPVALAAGLFDVTGFIAFGIGLEVAETWLVGLASSFGPALAVVVAFVFLGERPRRTQWLGFASILGGLVLVALP